jgi:molecular chaperone GrpE (heat shock protein)
MWSRILRFFRIRRKSCSEKEEKRRVSNEDLLEEVEAIKKILRKQNLVLEVFKKETSERLERYEIGKIQPFLDLAENFFHLSSFFTEKEDIQAREEEAIEIVWQKLESLLSTAGIRIIRYSGVAFDPALYQAVEGISKRCNDPIVTKILQPGFIYRGKVITHAKVSIGERENSERANEE